MSAPETTLKVTCPDWCTVPPQEHTDELAEWGGTCLHWSDDVVVSDPTGYCEPLREPIYAKAVLLRMSSSTRPDGTPTSSPAMAIDAPHEISLEQAEAVAAAITAMVARYRGGGSEAADAR